MYAWRATHMCLPQEALFVPCYCTNCRSAIPAACKYRHITHSLVSDQKSQYFMSHEVPVTAAGAAADGSDLE